jgi:hypothetical protein
MRAFDVWTDLPQDGITEIGFEIAKRWIAFAMGEEAINGYKIKNPTGRYASSIDVFVESPTHVAVVADEEIAPEALFLEEGHNRYDMKSQFPGRTFPMHRGAGTPILASTFMGRTNNVWATPRAEGFNGFARVPTHITPENADSWIIPAMPAFSPAQYLAEYAQRAINVTAFS